MDRNETYPLLSVATFSVHLAWASLEVVRDNVEDLQLFISGTDSEVNSLKITLEDGRLEVDQPLRGASAVNVLEGHWLTVFVRVPTAWKGAADFATTTGRLTVSGLVGSDLTLSTSSGTLTAQSLSFITISTACMNTEPHLTGISCEKLSVRSLNGDVHVQDSGARKLKLTTVNGDLSVSLREPFESVTASTVNGSLTLEAPITAVKVQRMAVAGHQRLFNVTAVEENAPTVNMKCVNGDLEITGIPEIKMI